MIARLVGAAWAPTAVAVLAWAVGRTPEARNLWWLLHLLGGAAMAFFFLRAIDVLRVVQPPARHAVAFSFACSAALAWELGEFAIDQLLGTRLQEGLVDTMSDLMFAVCGAAVYLAYAAFSESRG